jgi:acetyl-CoA acetyltransferase
MSGAQRSDIGHFQAYDASTVNLPIALEGAGFCRRGEGLDFVQAGRIEVGGALPCNTSGGLLSESYMHGQNHVVEAVRQLRHEAGERQVAGVEASMYVAMTTGTASCTVFERDRS